MSKESGAESSQVAHVRDPSSVASPRRKSSRREKSQRSQKPTTFNHPILDDTSMNTAEILVLVTIAVGSVIIYLAIFPPEEEKEQLSTSIFNRPEEPIPEPSVTKDGKKYSTVWPNVPEKHRKCEDGGRHSGSLEVVTWETPEQGLGWGATEADESPSLKAEFEEEMKCNFEKFYEAWPMGFRWTCCGNPGDYKWGCDHHFYPGCRCDNCRFGYRLPAGFLDERNKSPHAKGLSLGQGNVHGQQIN
ncbi:hypothetical protein GLAREA_08116 [Glarea lozoyensis ATCC 20868]|uniref:Uncharacterized protein n=1 Tax=Glarea lozoyensis (strain ATCC 20868 / MF5171) TaxID=1116229 RepID=S3CE35_GLAL2|nr:uncharacterized protein GLAREA_08116 [Glarea lozoyensis ATCC 20868]EPE24265.1 hypothetical protein GLAREA_08116 [Glarea lozoyensis ATCC 20868]